MIRRKISCLVTQTTNADSSYPIAKCSSAPPIPTSGSCPSINPTATRSKPKAEIRHPVVPYSLVEGFVLFFWEVGGGEEKGRAGRGRG